VRAVDDLAGAEFEGVCAPINVTKKKSNRHDKSAREIRL